MFRVPTIFEAIDQQSRPMDKMARNTEAFAAKSERAWRTVNSSATSIAKGAAIVGASVLAPLVIAGKAAIDFQDKMADIAKTTGLSGSAVDSYGNSILDLSSKSRTSIDDFLKIGEIGGQLGIVENDLVPFTDAVNKVNVADAITKIGSSINDLGAVGSSTSANITDFTLRLGALPDAMKPILTDTL